MEHRTSQIQVLLPPVQFKGFSCFELAQAGTYRPVQARIDIHIGSHYHTDPSFESLVVKDNRGRGVLNIVLVLGDGVLYTDTALVFGNVILGDGVLYTVLVLIDGFLGDGVFYTVLVLDDVILGDGGFWLVSFAPMASEDAEWDPTTMRQ